MVSPALTVNELRDELKGYMTRPEDADVKKVLLYLSTLTEDNQHSPFTVKELATFKWSTRITMIKNIALITNVAVCVLFGLNSLANLTAYSDLSSGNVGLIVGLVGLMGAIPNLFAVISTWAVDLTSDAANKPQNLTDLELAPLFRGYAQQWVDLFVSDREEDRKLATLVLQTLNIKPIKNLLKKHSGIKETSHLLDPLEEVQICLNSGGAISKNPIHNKMFDTLSIKLPQIKARVQEVGTSASPSPVVAAAVIATSP